MDNLGEFKKLLTDAKKIKKGGQGNIVKDVEKDVKEELGPVDQENFSQWMGKFSEKIASALVENGIEPETLAVKVRNLLDFLNTNAPQEETPFDCKPPLGKLDISFDEIAGQTKIKNDLRVNYIYPQTFPSLFTSKTKGILLYGPAGTGKTLLARAATAELKDVAFFAPTAGELRGKYEGQTEKNIDKVFACAKAAVDNPKSPYKLAVLFMDEFDAVAGARGDDQSMRRSVNALLQAMDGIVKSPKVSVIAATNYPWDIDDAILRRLSSRVFVDLPDYDARVWLVESVLAENYSAPQIPQDQRRKLFAESVKRGENIGVYGNIKRWGDRCYTEGGAKGWWQTGNKVTKAFVDAICGGKGKEKVKINLGPTKEGEAVIRKIAGGEYVNPEDYKKEDPIFGYSGSDVIKLMNTAVQAAAFQALEWYFEKVEIAGKTYYISQPEGVPIDDIPKKDRDRVVNYSICVHHVEEAFKQYPTTIRNDAYIRLLNYKYLGRVE